MAKKSKTQRAKASARRQARKAAEAVQESEAVLEAEEESKPEEKKSLLKRFSKPEEKAPEKKAAPAKAPSKEPKKPRSLFKKDGFFMNVRKEIGRVTWPSRQDVIRWTGVVVAALVFFGVYVFILDNLVVTPLLLGISSLGA